MIGQRLGHYRMTPPLGRGVMGEVHQAEDVRLGRRVAVKLLPAEVCSDPAAIERFEREARIVSSLNHPHIWTLHDIGVHDGRHFMVMELLEGETLGARIARGPLPVDDLLAFGADVAGALDAAHRQGVVHRDIKPANLFVSTSSGIKVLDFGVATLSDSSGALDTTPAGSDEPTMLGTTVGTVAYMSPEPALRASSSPRPSTGRGAPPKPPRRTPTFSSSGRRRTPICRSSSRPSKRWRACRHREADDAAARPRRPRGSRRSGRRCIRTSRRRVLASDQ